MEKEVKKIVLTGGPCAGKTTAMSWIQDTFEKQGYKVLFVPEEATELITGGITPWESSTIDFQTLIMKLQIQKEDAFLESTKFLNHDKFLIVCDRGILDNRAYMSDLEFMQCLKNNNLTFEEAKERYDACFHLVSAAKGAEEFYNLGNVARTETIEEAKELDDKTLRAWIGHSHLRVIDNNTDFSNKMKRLMQEISGVLGIPYPYEIERKFLIKKPNIEMLENLADCKKISIVQTYLKSDDEYETRIRKRGSNDSYSYTITKKKSLDDLRRIEVEQRISKEEYLELAKRKDENREEIIKDRYCLCYKNQYFEIDIYQFMEETAICEIELLDENQKVELPDIFELVYEVTGNSEYKNANLALKYKENKILKLQNPIFS